MNLHPYDGKQRRFRHSDDGDRTFALAIVERVLGLGVAARGLRYDLAFYSGGIGVLDHLYISLEASVGEWTQVAAGLGFIPAQAALANEHVRWLIGADDRPADVALAEFITEHKTDFQPMLDAVASVWFEENSGVNAWSLVYARDGWLHYLAFDQG